MWHHVADVFLTLFRYPDGIVVGNLVASVLWIPVQWLGTHLLLRRHARKVGSMLDEHHHRLARLQRYHDSQ